MNDLPAASKNCIPSAAAIPQPASEVQLPPRPNRIVAVLPLKTLMHFVSLTKPELYDELQILLTVQHYMPGNKSHGLPVGNACPDRIEKDVSSRSHQTIDMA